MGLEQALHYESNPPHTDMIDFWGQRLCFAIALGGGFYLIQNGDTIVGTFMFGAAGYYVYQMLKTGKRVELTTLGHTFKHPKVVISLGFEYPAKPPIPHIGTRIVHATEEALNKHMAQNGALGYDDIKALIFDATYKFTVVENDFKVFIIRVLSVEEKK